MTTNAATSNQDFSLKMQRTFKASREAVFDAWTDAEALSQWFAPDSNMTTIVEQLDTKQDGYYQIKMINPNQETFIVRGQYITFLRPEQLIFTWTWIHGDDKSEMLITLDFIDNGDTTEMQLLQEKLPDESSKNHHQEGWIGCFIRLTEFVTQ